MAVGMTEVVAMMEVIKRIDNNDDADGRTEAQKRKVEEHQGKRAWC